MTTFTTQDRQDAQREPVAWVGKDRETGIAYLQFAKPTRMDKVGREYIPLYGFKPELTDAEIEQVWTEVTCQEFNVPYSFARAILEEATISSPVPSSAPTEQENRNDTN